MKHVLVIPSAVIAYTAAGNGDGPCPLNASLFAIPYNNYRKSEKVRRYAPIYSSGKVIKRHMQEVIGDETPQRAKFDVFRMTVALTSYEFRKRYSHEWHSMHSRRFSLALAVVV